MLGLLKKKQLELSLLEDVYVTSRYIPKEIKREEVLELLAFVEEVINHEGGFY